MSYDFSNLWPADFEDLVRDLIGRELGVRFEGFAVGPDGGRDGRHAKNEETILQAKHYVGSNFSKLKSEMKKERLAIDKLAPDRYIVATSRPLSPDNKAELASIIGPSLKNIDDIFSQRDLNGLLRKFDDIHKAHLKLWLSESAVLEAIVHAASAAFNSITQQEISAKVRLYARNPSFYEASETLRARHLCIISGPPGVGKTTLAEMIAYTHIVDGWELVAIRNLEDGFARIRDSKKQIFYFDDFLGKIALDKRALSHTDSELARFIKRVSSSPNARFVLTTRAYIFEEARRVSEHLADKRLEIAKYLLDVGKYTREIKARILYNHLLAASTPPAHVASLVDSDVLPKIVDHKHYNPRIIEWMTDAVHLDGVSANGYPRAFLNALDHPDRLWDIAFRTHISKPCQHLLFCLYFLNEWGTEISELRTAYVAIHPRLSARYGDPHDAQDFEEALKILEGGFVTLSGTSVRYVNPSLRDFLSRYLSDAGLLAEFAKGSPTSSWAQSVWNHVWRSDLKSEEKGVVARAFADFAPSLLTIPTWTHWMEGNSRYRRPHELSNCSRIELLLDWWSLSRLELYIDIARSLATSPIDGFDAWHDGADPIKLVAHIRDGGYFDDVPNAEDLAGIIEGHVIEMIEAGISSDELERISDAVEEFSKMLNPKVGEAMDEAISSEIRHIDDVVSGIDSDATLRTHALTLKTLARRSSVTQDELDHALERINARKHELEESTAISPSPSVGSGLQKAETFDDAALRNLFSPLSRKG